jgi:hypothetical protein
MKGMFLRMIQAGHRLSLGRSRRRFERAMRSCEAAQSARLQQLIAANTDTAYGRAHHFGAIRSVGTWQDRVPIVEYDDLQPWVERAAAGEPRVLTSQPVRIFERTSGSTAANKLVPYTAGLLDEFAAATGPWLHDLYSSFPNLRGTTSYWSISPATRQQERTSGGIPIGFDDDTEYFGRLERYALRQMLAVPSTVARMPDTDAWGDRTARHLVAAGNLGLISVWHPSFLALLLRRIESNLDELLEHAPSIRRTDVRDRLKRGATLSEALWTRLSVVSCWADGAAAGAVLPLARSVPHAHVQPKGLLATEGVVSFPLHHAGATCTVTAVTGHFLEFMNLEHPAARPRLAHELRQGATYAPIISTAGGFYRYRLGDAVRCVGFYHQVPVLHFEGRIDHVSDLCGEKLNPHMVASAIEYGQRVVERTFDFVLVAPVAGDPPGYCLYAEVGDDSMLDRLCRAVERRLCDNHGYRYARALGQLAPLNAVRVRDGAARYILARARTGQRAGDIKPAHLDTRLDWSAVFGPSAEEISSRIEVSP